MPVQETQGQEQTDEEEKGRAGVRGPCKPRHIKDVGSREREKTEGRQRPGQPAARAGQDPAPRPSRCGLKPRPRSSRRPPEEARRPRPTPAHRPQRPLTRPRPADDPGRGGAPRPTRRRHRGLGARRQPPTAAPLRAPTPTQTFAGRAAAWVTARTAGREAPGACVEGAPAAPPAVRRTTPAEPRDFLCSQQGSQWQKGQDATDPGAWH